MEELILDQLEWLLAQNSGGSRYDRQIIALVGFLSDENMPENIAQQMRALSRQSMLRDIFDALVATMNTFAQNRMRPSVANEDTSMFVDLSPLIAQIESARTELSRCEPVYHAELIAWVVAKATEKKLLKGRRRR